MDEKNKRLIFDGNIIYPFTKQENVIGLQKTIKEKMPIITSQAPSAALDNQICIEIQEQDASQEDSNYEFGLVDTSTTVDLEPQINTFEQPEDYENETFEQPEEQIFFETVADIPIFGDNNDNEVLNFEGGN